MSTPSDEEMDLMLGRRPEPTTLRELMHKLDLIEAKIDRVKQEVITVGVGLAIGIILLSFRWK